MLTFFPVIQVETVQICCKKRKKKNPESNFVKKKKKKKKVWNYDLPWYNLSEIAQLIDKLTFVLTHSK